jgi:arylsulfatase A-like enzyme
MLPRDEFAGKSTNGEWGDCLLMLDHDFGVLLDKLDELRIANDTIVVFCGDNGAEDHLAGRGTGGFFDGSYFSSAEGGIRTPLLIRWPGKVKAGTESNEMDDEDLDSFVDTLARRLASFDREVLTSRGQGANQSVRHADCYRA